MGHLIEVMGQLMELVGRLMKIVVLFMEVSIHILESGCKQLAVSIRDRNSASNEMKVSIQEQTQGLAK